ncbi:MAG: methylated-DNA--[protein]-cysteine S-methyltransferase [Syntrophomonas sp.]
MKNLFFYPSGLGKIGIAENGKAITNLYFQNEAIPQDAVIYETDLLKEAGGQLQAYFSGKLRVFKLPLALGGTDFMRRVWQSLQTIPYGETRSYQEIAQSIDNKKACRAVGQANNRNPIPIIIPCHRVIGANGKLVGYGSGLGIKAKLLELEKQYGDL